MGKIDFKFEGDTKEFSKIAEDATWLLNQSLEKQITELTIQVTKGKESNFIKGLIVDIFSETGVNVKFV